MAELAGTELLGLGVVLVGTVLLLGYGTTALPVEPGVSDHRPQGQVVPPELL